MENVIVFEFKWEWCSTCERWTIICPKCGNNCCNGGYGPHTGDELDGTCEICALAHQYEDLAYKTNSQPDISKSAIKMMDSSMKNFKEGIVSDPIDLSKF